MTALIVMLAGWRMAQRRSHKSLPSAIDVALDHVIWLRLRDPRLSAYQAGLPYGLSVHTWAELVQALAAIWQDLPEAVRRGGNN
jgi:hypothetical protein